jgi:hypothetical protein
MRAAASVVIQPQVLRGRGPHRQQAGQEDQRGAAGAVSAIRCFRGAAGSELLTCRRYNYILVVGEEERSTNTVNSRTRDNVVHGTKTLEEIIAEFKVMAETFQA